MHENNRTTKIDTISYNGTTSTAIITVIALRVHARKKKDRKNLNKNKTTSYPLKAEVLHHRSADLACERSGLGRLSNVLQGHLPRTDQTTHKHARHTSINQEHGF